MGFFDRYLGRWLRRPCATRSRCADSRSDEVRLLRVPRAVLLAFSIAAGASGCVPTLNDLGIHSARALALEYGLEAVDRRDFGQARRFTAGARFQGIDEAGDGAIVECLGREDPDGARTGILAALDREIVFVSSKLAARPKLDEDGTWVLGAPRRIHSYRALHPVPASPSAAAASAAFEEAFVAHPEDRRVRGSARCCSGPR
jgi:hypothetical protein